jgi:membrane dipeptidase
MYPRIEKARQIGLEILKASTSEVEHGLALHKESFVCDVYGFSPTAAADNAVLEKLIDEGASRQELADARHDMAVRYNAEDESAKKEYMAAWEASGVNCVFQNAGEEGQGIVPILRRHARFTYLTDVMKDYVVRAAFPDDVTGAFEAGKKCLYFTANGVPLLQEWQSVEDELSNIRMMFMLGCRMMHVTYNRRNMLGDGCMEPADAGLSDFGRAAIKEMNRVGIMVDVAHSGHRTSLEAALASEKPMVISHSVCHALSGHPRGKPDNVIKAVADTGGYMGICAVPAFLGGSGDINAFLDHIDYACKLVGPDHVAIGLDRGYSAEGKPSGREYPKFRKMFESFWHDDEPMFGPKWNDEKMRLSLAWTNFPLFTVGLVQRGYSDDDIRKILGGNFLRVAKAVLPQK